MAKLGFCFEANIFQTGFKHGMPIRLHAKLQKFTQNKALWLIE